MSWEPDAAALFSRYQRLQQYVGWKDEETARIRAAAPRVTPHFPALVEDFYQEIDRHPEVRRVITGGAQQVARLKGTLTQWLTELFSGQYDQAYVLRRWRVGLRHAEIGLDQVYTNVALSRLRNGMLAILEKEWSGEMGELLATRATLNKLLDLDLAIIEDAYQAEYMARQQRTDRLVAIGQMAGGLAHELRNPLNVIKTSVYYLQNARSPSAEKVAEHLCRIERQVGLADKVITALSDFAKLPFPEVRPVDVADCIKSALEDCELPAEIEVLVEVPAHLPQMLADSDQLRIVLSNLIRNARDAMPQGGCLRLRASANGGLLQILVADTGSGIPREDLARIMEPLYSTKTRGLGLGLAITRAIVDKHHGRLTVTSEPGQGSTFTVELPAASDASDQP